MVAIFEGESRRGTWEVQGDFERRRVILRLRDKWNKETIVELRLDVAGRMGGALIQASKEIARTAVLKAGEIVGRM